MAKKTVADFDRKEHDMSSKMLTVKVKSPFDDVINEIEVEQGATFGDLSFRFEDEFTGQITLARANHLLRELGDEIPPDIGEIEFLDTSNQDGYRVYMRSLIFIFTVAVREIYPEAHVMMQHSISGGHYCTLRVGTRFMNLDSRTRDAITGRMRKIIECNEPIRKQICPIEDLEEIYSKEKRQDKLDILQYRKRDKFDIYDLRGIKDSFFGYMVPSTGFIQTFDLELFNRGLVIIGPEPGEKDVVRNFTPQHKLSIAYNEIEKWTALQGITKVHHLNQYIASGNIGEVCRVTESLQTHKIMKIGEEIQSKNKRIILISAPSSSGKTSFAYKLTTALRVLGMRPIYLSMDDYYVNRADTPLDEQGLPDFESLYAVDLELFNRHLNDLIRGDSIPKISYDFLDGVRKISDEQICLPVTEPIIIEGIHALNPELTSHIPDSLKYKIYLSVITQINLDNHNRIPTTDLRLMRRMARDKQFRGKPVENTIMEWSRVREGEIKNIFPYQEEADVVFNSSFVYEIAALKPLIEDELNEIPEDHPAFNEVQRLLSFLQYFHPMEDTSDIENTSILREFIGGSKIV